MPLTFTCAAATDVGRRRSNNEDSYGSFLSKEVSLFVVADGMGGHAAGETASAIARDTILRSRQQFARKTSQETISEIRSVMSAADDAVLKEAARDSSKDGMGTTCLCLVGCPNGLRYGHVGDSRIYWIRNGQGKQVTRDHGFGHMLTNVIGGRRGSFEGADADRLQAQPGDLFVLCSDGLSDYASAAEVCQIVERVKRGTEGYTSKFLGEVCKACIQHALDAGGHDNITVMAVEVGSSPR